MSVPSRAKPVFYDSAELSNPAIEELREVWNYRNLIYQLTRRDILSRYKRSILGVAWTMLNPLGMMLVLTIAFSELFRFQTEYSYAGYVLSGLMVWNFFSQTTTASMVNLVWGGGLLHRIYVPRTSFALAAMLTGVVNFILSLVPLLLVFLITRVPFSPTILIFPIPLLLLVCFSLGVGLLISTLAVYFPDVSEMYSIAMLGWMYLTPVIYPESVLPQNYQFWITHLNPMYYMVKLFRIVVYYGDLPSLMELLPAVLIALVTLAIGWTVFTKKAGEFAYRI
ncbi:MAG: ABC transporter permease [Chloroflexi bacterium]|nr:ABC transporter permease [Chloroflexota bacterium]